VLPASETDSLISRERRPGAVLDIPGARFRAPTVMRWVNDCSKSRISEQQGTTARVEVEWSVKSPEYLVLVERLLTQKTELIEGGLGQRQGDGVVAGSNCSALEHQPDPV